MLTRATDEASNVSPLDPQLNSRLVQMHSGPPFTRGRPNPNHFDHWWLEPMSIITRMMPVSRRFPAHRTEAGSPRLKPYDPFPPPSVALPGVSKPSTRLSQDDLSLDSITRSSKRADGFIVGRGATLRYALRVRWRSAPTLVSSIIRIPARAWRRATLAASHHPPSYGHDTRGGGVALSFEVAPG